MADAYGMDSLALLTGPQQDTARTIQNAFTNSAARYMRDTARYPMLAPSAPQISANMNDRALTEASTISNILNQNQQIQNLIDASHATPHGVGANIAAYLPYLNAIPGLSQLLFGSGAANILSKGGLLEGAKSAAKAIASWFTDPVSGQTYPLDAQGNVVGTDNPNGYPNPGSGVDVGTDLYDSGWNPAAVDFGMGNGSWDVPGYTGAVTAPYIDNAVIDTSAWDVIPEL